MDRWRIAVVGGGWAGMAAAVDAVRRGFEVTLFEMAPHWGGRARRVDIDGLALDNGQHIMIGAYRETLRLMQAVGVDLDAAFVRTPLHLTAPDGQGLVLPAGAAVPSFVRGVLGQRAWPLADRWALLRTAAAWGARGFRCDESETVHGLSQHLPARVREELIEPLCVAALNTPAREASGSVFLRVMRDALFGGRGSADLLLPRQRLSELFPLPAARWLAAAGARLHLATRVEHIEQAGVGWRVDGEAFDGVVVAASAAEAARLIGPLSPTWSEQAAALTYEPIVTVYAKSPGTRLPRTMLSLRCDPERDPAQFVFDLGQLGGDDGLLAFVISGARPWLERGIDQTQHSTLAQGTRALGRHLGSPLLAVRTLTEKRATFRCTPGLRRPAAAVAEGLHAAGDYVAGPYPATLEGAVRSAVAAVQALSAAR